MTNPYRALCEELVDDLSAWMEYGDAPIKLPFEEARTYRLLKHARTLLAEPQGTDGEVPRIGHILRLAEIIREVDGKHDKGAAALAEAVLSHPGIRSAGLTAALAEPVAEPGEVPELVAWLRENAEDERQMSNGDNPASLNLYRAATLLEQRHHPAPPAELEGVTSQ